MKIISAHMFTHMFTYMSAHVRAKNHSKDHVEHEEEEHAHCDEVEKRCKVPGGMGTKTLGMWGSEAGGCNLGFGVQELGAGNSSSEFRVQGLGSRTYSGYLMV